MGKIIYKLDFIDPVELIPQFFATELLKQENSLFSLISHKL